MWYKKVLLISDNIIRVNHLLLILKEMGIHEYDLTRDVIKAQQVCEYGGVDLIFISKKKFYSNPSIQNFLSALNIPVIFMSKNDLKLQHSNFHNPHLVAEITIPFIGCEVKSILKDLHESKNRPSSLDSQYL